MTVSECPIGDFVERCQTWNPKTSGAGSFDYIDLSSVDKDTKSINSIERYECSDAPSRARQLVETGDVLVATVRPNLNGVALVNGAEDGMTASTGYCVLRPKDDKLDSRYLFHWVKTHMFIKRMVDVAIGANYPAVSDAKVKTSTIPLPPLAEQKRIAAILDAADALRTKRRESLAQLDTLLQSTFLEMFGDPVTNPMGWEVVTIENAALHIGDGNYSSKYPKASDFVSKGVPFIRANNIEGNTVIPADMRFISEEQHAKLKKGHLLAGDVLITTRGDVGQVAVVPHEFDDANINAQLVLLRPTNSTISSRYLCHLLATSSMRQKIKSVETGVALKQLPIRSLKKISLIIPPLDLQNRFVSIVESVEQQKVTQRQHLEELDMLFAALQQRAFNGELTGSSENSKELEGMLG